MSDYEGHRAEPEQAARNVFRVDGTTGEITSVCHDFRQPNGLAFSPDESRLYIADSAASHDAEAPRHIRAFEVEGDRLTGGKVFAEIDVGIPDGIRVDDQGHL